jgi:hypothetical protein
MRWFKNFEICKNCKCVCVCKDNIIIRKLSTRLSKRRKMTIDQFFDEWKKQIDQEDKEGIEVYQKAMEKVRQTKSSKQICSV